MSRPCTTNRVTLPPEANNAENEEQTGNAIHQSPDQQILQVETKVMGTVLGITHKLDRQLREGD